MECSTLLSTPSINKSRRRINLTAFFRDCRFGYLRCHSQSYNCRYIFCARPPASFLDTAVHERQYPCASLHPECSAAARSVKLVARQAQGMDAQFLNINRYVACTCHRVGVESGAVFGQSS